HKESGTYWSALVAKVSDPDGRIQAVHRTWIDGHVLSASFGKAPVEPAKASLGLVSGGAIRLSAAAEELILAEGIETTWSAMQLYELPGWCGVSASNMLSSPGEFSPNRAAEKPTLRYGGDALSVV
ncbi:MAG TPA: hypothetical protein VFJ49_12475, partial [Methyloceanibacter sp.]|nr:hypothetical protein [Methyloceanibacter sp.]